MSPNSPNRHPHALLTDDRPIRLIGLLVLLLTVGVFGIWAGFAPLDSAAVAPGFITVKSHKKTVQHREGGIVSQLLVKDGDWVREGDLLLVLDATENKAVLETARGQFISLSAQLARLEAERDRLPAPRFPPELLNSADKRCLDARKNELALFQARKQSHEGEIEIFKQQLSLLKSKISGMQAVRASKQVLVASYSEEIKDWEELLSSGYADKLRLRELQRNYQNNLGEIASLTADIAGAEIQLGENRLKILQLEQKFQEDVSARLNQTQSELYEVNQRLLASQDKMQRVEIKAPVPGRVMGLTVHTLGGVLPPGGPILEIVPQEEELIIDAQVSVMDVDKVNLGMLAEVRFPGFKQADLPSIEGKVINLSADRVVDERSGSAYYQAQIELTPESQQKMSHLALLPGMPVEVMIKTGERTMMQYLTKPITQTFNRAFVEE